MSPENFRKTSLPELQISLYLSNFRKEEGQITDWQTYKKNLNNMEIGQKYPGNVSKKFQKDISSRTGDIPILA